MDPTTQPNTLLTAAGRWDGEYWLAARHDLATGGFGQAFRVPDHHTQPYMLEVQANAGGRVAAMTYAYAVLFDGNGTVVRELILQGLPSQFRTQYFVRPNSFVTDAAADRIFVTTNHYVPGGLPTLTSSLMSFSARNGSLLLNTSLCQSTDWRSVQFDVRCGVGWLGSTDSELLTADWLQLRRAERQ